MKALSICDHDVVDGQIEAIEAGKIFSITVIPSVEFYTDVPGLEIIAHFPDVAHFMELLNARAFDSVCDPIKAAKQHQFRAMHARIEACFAPLNIQAEITENDILTYIRNGLSSKGDFSVILWQKYGDQLRRDGVASDVKDFHAKFTTRDEQLNVPLEVDLDLSAAAFIQRIRQWSGLPGMAHPPELLKKERGYTNETLFELICALADKGLQTLEVDGWRNGICPETGRHQTDVFEAMRLQYNAQYPERLPLLYTNGSDSHNLPGEGLELGCGFKNNLRPEFGRFPNINTLLLRQKKLHAEPSRN